jgi:hypothetical protein
LILDGGGSILLMRVSVPQAIPRVSPMLVFLSLVDDWLSDFSVLL